MKCTYFLTYLHDCSVEYNKRRPDFLQMGIFSECSSIVIYHDSPTFSLPFLLSSHSPLCIETTPASLPLAMVHVPSQKMVSSQPLCPSCCQEGPGHDLPQCTAPRGQVNPHTFATTPRRAAPSMWTRDTE